MAKHFDLVLTGEVLPGFAPELVWPELAKYIPMEPDKLMALVARAPLIVGQGSHLGQLQVWQNGITRTGAQSEICPPDDRPPLFVLLEGTPRGPVSRLMIEQRVRRGLWADSILVAQAGAAEWTRYSELDLPAAAPSILVADPSPAPSPAWAANPEEREPASELPPGDAIHAGFWRRNAAMTLDFLIIILPLLLVNMIPWVGALVGLIGQWLYFALMDSSRQQATLGKRAMGIKVVDESGRRLGFGRATWRFFSELVPAAVIAAILIVVFIGDIVGHQGIPSTTTLVVFGVTYFVVSIAWCITYAMIGWTRRKQSLYDMMAGTLIVFKPVEPGQPLPDEQAPMPWYGWALNILVVLIPLPLGIAAAIAVPAYQDYTIRTRVAEALVASVPLQTAMVNQGCPSGNLPAPSRSISAVQVEKTASGRCTIRLTLPGQAGKALGNGAIALTAGAGGHWACAVGSARLFKYVPANCRNLAAEQPQ